MTKYYINRNFSIGFPIYVTFFPFFAMLQPNQGNIRRKVKRTNWTSLRKKSRKTLLSRLYNNLHSIFGRFVSVIQPGAARFQDFSVFYDSCA